MSVNLVLEFLNWTINLLYIKIFTIHILVLFFIKSNGFDHVT